MSTRALPLGSQRGWRPAALQGLAFQFSVAWQKCVRGSWKMWLPKAGSSFESWQRCFFLGTTSDMVKVFMWLWTLSKGELQMQRWEFWRLSEINLPKGFKAIFRPGDPGDHSMLAPKNRPNDQAALAWWPPPRCVAPGSLGTNAGFLSLPFQAGRRSEGGSCKSRCISCQMGHFWWAFGCSPFEGTGTSLGLDES